MEKRLSLYLSLGKCRPIIMYELETGYWTIDEDSAKFLSFLGIELPKEPKTRRELFTFIILQVKDECSHIGEYFSE